MTGYITFISFTFVVKSYYYLLDFYCHHYHHNHHNLTTYIYVNTCTYIHIHLDLNIHNMLLIIAAEDHFFVPLLKNLLLIPSVPNFDCSIASRNHAG